MGLLSRLRQRFRPQQSPTAAATARTPRSLARVLSAVVARARLLQLLLIAVGVVGLCLVPLLERKIDFDENALLAGSARPTISLSSAYDAGRAFADSLQHTYHTHTFTAALQAALAAAPGGLDVSHHTFRTSRAVAAHDSFGSSPPAVRECVNVHAVLHSPRGDGKEALVLVTPVNHQHFVTDFHQDASGVRLSLSLGYALLSHLSASAAWLSKEVVWLLPDASCGLLEAVSAWTHAYQLTPLDQAAGSGSPQATFKRAGVLQQALLLELPSGNFNRVQVVLEGHEGQLPKLDMYWIYRWYSQAYITAAVELPQLRDQQQQQQLTSPPLRALHTTLRATLLPLVSLLSPLLASAGVDLSTTTTLTTATAAGSNTYSPQQQPTVSASQLLLDQLLATHLHKLQVMCQFMGRQAAGLPTGAHAAFKGLGVDAATLRVLMRNDAGAIVGPVGYTGGGNSADMVAMMMQRQQQPGLANITDSGGVSAAAFVSPISYYTQHQQFGGDPAAALGGGVQPQVLLGDASSAILVGFDSALHQLGNVMEAALRSCSVLIERFHHSLLLYVLTGLNHYVSVERYIGPLVALIGVLVLQAAYLNSNKNNTKKTAGPVAAAAEVKHAAAHQASGPDDSTTTGGLHAVLQSQALQLPPCQDTAAAARQQWVAALQVVLLAHAASLAGAAATRCLCLRQPPHQPSQQQQQQQLQQQGLFGLGSAGGVGAWVTLLAVLLAAESLMSLFGSSFSSSSGGRQRSRRSNSDDKQAVRGGGGSDGIASFLRKVLVVELSVAAAVLAAIACINWALGYVTCLLLVPLAMASGGGGGQALRGTSNSTSNSSRRSSSSSSSSSVLSIHHCVLRLTTLMCCSPVALLVCLSLVLTPPPGAGVGVAGGGVGVLTVTAQWLRWLVVDGSSWGTYLVAFGVYLPCWCLVVLAASVGG